MKIRTNLGNIYLEKAYTNIVNIAKVNTTWFTKKKGINWGMFIITDIDIIYVIYTKKVYL